jgi:putative transposase
MPSALTLQDTKLRAETVRHLLHLDQQNALTTLHLNTVAQAYGVHQRTVRRWIDNARAHNGTYTLAERHRFTLTAHMVDEIAIARGNINAAYQRLTDHPYPDDPPLPNLATFYTAVHAVFDKGMLIGLRHGEKARRRYDVHGQEIFDHRNQVWEGDHVQASVWVDVEGEPVKAWITWFIDCFTKAILGWAITPGYPNSGSIMAAVRSALVRDRPYSPFGGRPGIVRIDGGKDFRSQITAQAFGALAAPLCLLPPGDPEGKGTIEGLNSAVKSNLFQSLPGFVEDDPPTQLPRSTPSGSRKPASTEGLMPFQDFVAEVERWITTWNHRRPKRSLGNRTPAHAWNDDLTVIFDVDKEALHTYTLVHVNKPLIITNNGVHWKNNRYIAPWMHGEVTDKVLLRHMPNHTREVELYDAVTSEYLGTATAADQASPELRRAVKVAAQEKAARLQKLRTRAEKQRVERYVPVTAAQHPQVAHALSRDQAFQQLSDLDVAFHAFPATPDLLPLPAPSLSWDTDSEKPTLATPPPGQSAQPDLLPLPAPSPSWTTGPAAQLPAEPAHPSAEGSWSS